MHWVCDVYDENTFRLSSRGDELNFTKFLSLLNKENILSKMKASKNLKDQRFKVQHKKSINFKHEEIDLYSGSFKKINFHTMIS